MNATKVENGNTKTEKEIDENIGTKRQIADYLLNRKFNGSLEEETFIFEDEYSNIEIQIVHQGSIIDFYIGNCYDLFEMTGEEDITTIEAAKTFFETVFELQKNIETYCGIINKMHCDIANYNTKFEFISHNDIDMKTIDYDDKPTKPDSVKINTNEIEKTEEEDKTEKEDKTFGEEIEGWEPGWKNVK